MFAQSETNPMKWLAVTKVSDYTDKPRIDKMKNGFVTEERKNNGNQTGINGRNP